MQIKPFSLISGWHQSGKIFKIFAILVLFGIDFITPGICSVVELEDAIAISAPAPNISNVSSLDRLHADLLIHYDKTVHPMVGGKASSVNLSMVLNYFDVDELNGKFILHCWLNIRWMDELFKWNASEFENINQIHLRAHEVWKPQITLFNTAGDGDAGASTSLMDTQVTLSNDGKFMWVPPAVYTAYCNLNMRNWPYDQQHCKLKIGSWSLNNKIHADYIKSGHSLEYDDSLVQSSEWEVISGNAKYVNRDYYNYIEYSFTVQRRSSMYTAIIYTPASCIVILTLAVFWLPSKLGEKIVVNGLLIVLIAAMLMYFAQLLPILAENTPNIVIFYSSSLLLVSFSTIIEVVVLYLSTTQHKRRLPKFLRKLLDGPLGTLLLLSHFTFEGEQSYKEQENDKREMNEHIYDDIDPLSINPEEVPTAQAIQYDWILLATAVDRISFLIFSLIFSILAIIYAV